MSTQVSSPTQEGRRTETAKPGTEAFRHEVAAHIGRSVMIKGELSGSEDLYLDGHVDGSIELNNHTLTVGPNGRIRANIIARQIVMHGRAEGNITASERVELKSTCVLSGDITSPRIVIEEGAFFKGSVDPGRVSGEQRPKAAAAAAAAGTGTGSTSLVESSELIFR